MITIDYCVLLTLSPMPFYFQNNGQVKVKYGICILYTPGTY